MKGNEMPNGRKRFNWQLAVVMVLSIGVLGGTMYVLHGWRRGKKAEDTKRVGEQAYSAGDWETAARQIGMYIAVHREDEEGLLKYADAQLKIQPLKVGNVQHAVGGYRQILRVNPAHRDGDVRVYRECR